MGPALYVDAFFNAFGYAPIFASLNAYIQSGSRDDLCCLKK